MTVTSVPRFISPSNQVYLQQHSLLRYYDIIIIYVYYKNNIHVAHTVVISSEIAQVATKGPCYYCNSYSNYLPAIYPSYS